MPNDNANHGEDYRARWQKIGGWEGAPYAKPGKGKEQIDSQLLKAFVEANDYLIAPSKSRSRYWHNIVTRIGYNTRGNCYDHLRGGMADLTDHSGFYDLHPAFQPLGRGVIIGQPYDTGNGPLREFVPHAGCADQHTPLIRQRMLAADLGFIDYGREVSWYFPGHTHLVIIGARADVERLIVPLPPLE